MALRVTCPKCRLVDFAPDSAAGQVVTCGECQHQFRLSSDGSGRNDKMTSRYFSRFSCYLIGASIGAAIGTKIQVQGLQGLGEDLRYGLSAVGGVLGWVMTPLLFAVAFATACTQVSRKPSHTDADYRKIVTMVAEIDLVVVGLINLVVLGVILLWPEWKKGVPVFLFVVASGHMLSRFVRRP